MRAAGKRWITYTDPDAEIKLTYFSDLHWMAAACYEKGVRKAIQEIFDDPNHFWIGGGDYAEFIGYTDTSRFDPDAVADWVAVKDLGKLGKVAYTSIGKELLPIQHKCLGLIEGNHERQYARRTQQQNLFGDLCTLLDPDHDLNLGYSCLMDVHFVRRSGKTKPKLLWQAPEKIRPDREIRKRVFCHHGAGAAQTKGGKINRLVRFMRYFEADIYMIGHVHDDLGARITPLGANDACDHIENTTKIGVISGSYLKTYAQDVTTYGEQKGYEPVSLGAAWVKFRPGTGELSGRI